MLHGDEEGRMSKRDQEKLQQKNSEQKNSADGETKEGDEQNCVISSFLPSTGMRGVIIFTSYENDFLSRSYYREALSSLLSTYRDLCTIPN